MSSFWLNRLGNNRPPAPAPPLTAHTRPWWDTTPPPAPPPAPGHQAPHPMTPPAQPQEYRPHQAQSARVAENCPGCFSGNYMPTGPSTKKCFDCGYPVVQSTTGIGVSSSGGENVQPARQISTANNFNPGTIVGRV